MALVTRQLAGNNASRQALADKLWLHSALVAVLAQVVARHIHQDPEAAMFAGLIHELGGFYLISRADDFPGLLDENFTEWIEYGEIEIGRAVLNKLSLPGDIVAAIEGYWYGYMSMPPTSLADTILIAEALAPVPSPLHHFVEQNRNSDLPSRLDMEIDEETLTGILLESAEEIRSLTEALKF